MIGVLFQSKMELDNHLLCCFFLISYILNSYSYIIDLVQPVLAIKFILTGLNKKRSNWLQLPDCCFPFRCRPVSSNMAGGITETGEPYSAFVSIMQNTVIKSSSLFDHLRLLNHLAIVKGELCENRGLS